MQDTALENDENDEIAGVVADIFERSGYDFSQYSANSRRRRLLAFLRVERLSTLAELRRRLADDPACLARLLPALSVSATAMFRDPEVFQALRSQVMPTLATYPTVRIWLAGCATGEEAWSLAILLHEAGILARARIYATDINGPSLEKAKSGIFPLGAMPEYAANYRQSGGSADLARYYTAAYGYAKFDATLVRNLVFAQHNLAIDGSFNEFNLILCRNVLIYFDDALQARVHGLFHASLAQLGVLCLGIKESLPPGMRHRYATLDATHRLYRRMAISDDVDPTDRSGKALVPSYA